MLMIIIMKCIESIKRLIYFITKNNVAPSHPRQIYCFNLSLLNMRYCFNDFSLAYRDIILFTCVLIENHLHVNEALKFICAFKRLNFIKFNEFSFFSRNFF